MPALFAARVKQCERGSQLLVIGGAGLARLTATQPVLQQKLLAAAACQQQDLTALLARRAVIWRGGGWRGTLTAED